MNVAAGLEARLFAVAPWMADALCRGVTGDLFFPQRGDSPAPAKAICNLCPAKTECLNWALDNHETGVWGGTTSRERMLLRRPPPIRQRPNNCGTESGYLSHRYYRELPCTACLAAKQAQQRARRDRSA